MYVCMYVYCVYVDTVGWNKTCLGSQPRAEATGNTQASMAIIAALSLPEIDRPKYDLAAVQCARIRSTRIDGQTSGPLTDRLPTTLSLVLSRGTWLILDGSIVIPTIFTDTSIDSFFLFFSPRSSPRSNDSRSRVVSKWLIGCSSSEVFHRFVSRENDE